MSENGAEQTCLPPNLRLPSAKNGHNSELRGIGSPSGPNKGKDHLLLTLRPLLLGHDAGKAFSRAFELRIGVERGAEIVERFVFRPRAS